MTLTPLTQIYRVYYYTSNLTPVVTIANYDAIPKEFLEVYYDYCCEIIVDYRFELRYIDITCNNDDKAIDIAREKLGAVEVKRVVNLEEIF